MSHMSILKSATAPNHAIILLVDDNKMGLAARRSVLEELGHTVVTANNGLDGFEKASAQKFDLVVTDWKMPKVDGLELIRRLRDGVHSGPIILLSGFADGAGLREESSGADAVVQKSANEIQMLLRAVKSLLSKKAPRKPPAREGNEGEGGATVKVVKSKLK
jgi:CheY-like chemotaxis protein